MVYMLCPISSGTLWNSKKSRTDEIHANSTPVEEGQTPLNLSGKDLEGAKLHFDCTNPQRYRMKFVGNTTKMLCVLGRLKETKDQGLQFLQTTSFRIMAYVTIPGDCSHRLDSSERRSRNFREASSTKASTLGHVEEATRTAAAAARFQHRRSKTLDTGRLGEARPKCNTTQHITETDQAVGNRMPSVSKMEVDTHLGDKVCTESFFKPGY